MPVDKWLEINVKRIYVNIILYMQRNVLPIYRKIKYNNARNKYTRKMYYKNFFCHNFKLFFWSGKHYFQRIKK